MTVVAGKDDARPEFVIPSVQSGAEAASLVATVCADGTRLPLFLVVTGSGGRVPYAVLEQDDGSTRKTPLASYLDEGAEVHRREKPGFDGPLWELYARFAARNLEKKCPGEWKVLLMDGCKVHASSAGLTVLKQSKVVVLMFPSHLSHILQALDKDPFLKVKARGRTAMRTIIPTLPPKAKFNLVHLMRVINESAFYGLSSVNVINGFRQTGTWPINPTAIDVSRLVKGKGPVNAKRKVNLEQLIVRLGPEARRDMRNPVLSFGSVSTRGRAVEATSEAVLETLRELDAAAARKVAAKEKTQATRAAKTAAAIADEARAEVEAEVRRNSLAYQARKASLRRRAARARAAAGSAQPYTCASGAVVEEEPRRKRAR